MSETMTPHLALDYLMPEQAQKHVTINDALRRLDGLVQLSVKSRIATAPPATPQNGDRYLIAANASGAWQTHDGKLALYEDTGWGFITPQAGWSLWDEAEKTLLVFDGEAWKSAVTGEAPMPLFTTEEAIFEPAKSTGALKIPSHITLLGVTARVVQKITGPKDWQLGTNHGGDRFGSGLGLAANTEVRGPADPPQVYWQEEDIVLTAKGGAFTGGRIAVAIHYIRLPLPNPA